MKSQKMHLVLNKIKITTALLLLAATVIAAFSAVSIAQILVDIDVRYVPGYETIDLRTLSGIEDGSFSDAGYDVVFRQTGLGKDAVDRVFHTESNPVAALEAYQNAFFNPPGYECYSIGIITREERLFDDEGMVTRAYRLADVRDGDIFITKATHSIGWRHGHGAIVIDAEKGKTLEAVLWGYPTEIQNVSKWRTYPTFVQLRPKEKAFGAKAAKIAPECLLGVDYGLLTGLVSKYVDPPKTTQCAHLPWYAYMSLGCDIDSNGGWLVTPRDIVGSKYLDVVQIYGVDPDKIW